MKENKTKTNEQQEELINKAMKMMLDYNQATGCSICIYDKDYKPYAPMGIECYPEKTICRHCKNNQPGHEPCHEMHINAIKETNKTGGFHIYKCALGFLFWVSPIYTEGSFSGAIRGGGFLAETDAGEVKPSGDTSSHQNLLRSGKKTVDIYSNANDTLVMCTDDISKEDFKGHINSSPRADEEKAQSLAEMMQLCAESLSSGSEDYHETIKRRAEQQDTIVKIIENLKSQHNENVEKPGYPLEKEKNLMSALRKGDANEAKKQLNELLAMVFFSYPGQFKYIQLRITELVILISRVEISPVKSGNLSMEINSQNLKFVQEAKSIEELTDIIHTIVDRVTSVISSFRGIPHAAALRKAENFILENFTRKISLKEISAVAGLSPPYFSTIFKEEMGENLSKYLNRLRVEKASRLLLETDMSLSEIAACCCFEDQSWFTKIFKAYIGISPGKYRNQGGGFVRDNSDDNGSQALRKIQKK
ncbi:MAG: helix-turn-helix domain-containing protein [Treponema sp.]|jgi:AraC-like DNA-binding protein/ligand-binding sensor protein|nr:helix-turn-helix domain-containing protein [Treponema sp.]